MPKELTCPHCGKPLKRCFALYIEVCEEHQYAFDVFHGKEVEWDWLMGDDDLEDEDDFIDWLGYDD